MNAKEYWEQFPDTVRELSSGKFSEIITEQIIVGHSESYANLKLEEKNKEIEELKSALARILEVENLHDTLSGAERTQFTKLISPPHSQNQQEEK